VGSKYLLFGILFGILSLGITSGQMAFAEPGTDESGVSQPSSDRAETNTLEPVEPDPNVGATFFGNGGYSADGVGISPSGTLLAEIPPGSTVEQAYLYSSTWGTSAASVVVNFDGTQYSLSEMTQSTYNGCCNLKAFKHTSPELVNQVKVKVGSGSVTPFSFPITEVSPSTGNIDGVGLVVIFSNPTLPENSIIMVDGGLPVTSEKTIIGLGQPLDKTVDGFDATLSLGIGFSFPGADGTCGSGQVSRVDINGQRLTSCAGGADDGFNSNGGLFTIGGVGDDTNNPPNPNGPGGLDDELYSISDLLNQGDTTIEIDTENFSSNDIIFLAIVQITARASVGEICGDGIDNDEDGLIDEGCEVDPPEGPFCKEYDFNAAQVENDSIDTFTFGGFAGAADWSGVGSIESVQGYTEDGFDGTFLRNTASGNPASKTTLTLTDLPEHTSIDLEFLLAIIDSWDGSPPGGCCNPDIFNVFVDGIEIFSESFGGNSATYDLPPIGERNQKGFNPSYKDVSYNMTNDNRFQNIPHTSNTLTIDFFASGQGWQAGFDESWAIENVAVGLDDGCTIPEPQEEKKSSGGDNQWDTRPTFGVSHETRQGLIVENGFSFNGDYFTVTDNHHTDFAEQTVEIGTMNSFTATVYADKKLKVQEFLFGIPNVGESHLAELGIEVWYDRDGVIEDVVVDQDTAVIDEGTISVSHEKTKCLSTDPEPLCDTTTVAMTFLEPLADKVMAVKAIDYALRDQRTYLNDGFDISGDSLNPMLTQMIPSNVKNQGLLEVTQMAKYSPYWQSADGRMFEMNSFGSFKEINQSFERFQDSGNAFTRLHSGFGGILDYEQNRATQVFDSTKLISDLPDSFGYHFEMTERLNDQLINEMLDQQEIAKKILQEMDKQTRHH
jgi:hypothetical protein